MKYNINDLYFAKCRHYIMDMINVLDENGQIMSPHPDYIDYYTILLFRDDEYVNIYNKSIKYREISNDDSSELEFGEGIIMEKYSLLDYIDTRRKKISAKDCELIDNTIQKTKSLTHKYGYKKRSVY